MPSEYHGIHQAVETHTRQTIALVTPSFTPAEAFGGPVTAIATLTRSLCKSGYVVKIYTTNVLDPQRPNMSYGLPSLEHIEGVTIKRYRPLFTIFGYWVTPMILKDLLTDPFDIINAHCVRSFQFDIAALVSWIKNRKLIATPHGSLYSYGAIPHGLRRLLFSAHNAILKFVFRRAHTVVATSPEEENQFTRFGLDIGKIVPLQNFLDETQFVNLPSPGEFRKQQGIGLDENVILFLGRLDRIKGLDLLLRAFSKISKRMDGVWLVIVGPDGGYQGTIKQMVNGYEVS